MEYCQALAAEELVAAGIPFPRVQMDGAINLNDKLCPGAVEIDDKRPDGVLATEPMPVELPFT